MTKFDDALKVTLVYEGGFSDNPKDPGGRTMKGITQRTYDAYTSHAGLPQKDVKLIGSRDLQNIYRMQYWDAIKGDELPVGLGLAVFDFAVNSGPARAAKVLQRLLGVKADGQIGARTLAAIETGTAVRDPEGLQDLLAEYSDKRLSFLRTLKTWPDFKNGWSDRVNGVENVAVKMALADEQPDTHPVPAAKAGGGFDPFPDEQALRTPKADEDDALLIKTRPGVVGALAAVAATAPVILQTANALAPFIGHDVTAKITTGVGSVVAIAAAATALYNALKPFLKQE